MEPTTPSRPDRTVDIEGIVLAGEREALRRGQLERVCRHVFNVKPSGPQLALLRAADGRPVGNAITDEESWKYFGCARELLGRLVPAIVVVVAGIRSGKSLLVAIASICRAFTARMEHLKPHLIPKSRIVCPKAENATETFRHVLGGVEESRGLFSCMVGEPKWSPHPNLVVRRFDGRKVEVSVGAADAGGLSMRSGNLTGFVLDEAALFGGASQGAAVNAEAVYHAAETRVLPGGQGWIVSSPFGPEGLLYELWRKHYGKPGNVLVMHAPTLAMNPTFSRELVERVRAENSDVAAREYDAEWVDADTAFFQGILIDAAVRAERATVEPQAGSRYLATMDAGTRGNAWTLIVARDTRAPTDRMPRGEIASAHEWIGSRQKPLDPAEVFAEMKELVRPYGVRKVNCDAYAIDPFRAVAKQAGLELLEHTFQGEAKLAVYRAVDLLTRVRRLELPPIAAVARDLKAVRKRAGEGRIVPFLPITADGRHCDYAPAISLAVWLLGGSNFASDLAAAAKNMSELIEAIATAP